MPLPAISQAVFPPGNDYSVSSEGSGGQARNKRVICRRYGSGNVSPLPDMYFYERCASNGRTCRNICAAPRFFIHDRDATTSPTRKNAVRPLVGIGQHSLRLPSTSSTAPPPKSPKYTSNDILTCRERCAPSSRRAGRLESTLSLIFFLRGTNPTSRCVLSIPSLSMNIRASIL